MFSARILPAAALLLSLLAMPLPSRAQDAGSDSDLPGASLGLSESASPSLGLAFLSRERLSHSRSLSFGFATSSGAFKSQSAAASYTDFFAYRMRDNLRLALALEYRLSSTSRTLAAETGDFSVLPAFALEYTPSANSVIRLSYEHASATAPGFGRPWYSSPWAWSAWNRSPFAAEAPDSQ